MSVSVRCYKTLHPGDMGDAKTLRGLGLSEDVTKAFNTELETLLNPFKTNVLPELLSDIWDSIQQEYTKQKTHYLECVEEVNDANEVGNEYDDIVNNPPDGESDYDSLEETGFVDTDVITNLLDDLALDRDFKTMGDIRDAVKDNNEILQQIKSLREEHITVDEFTFEEYDAWPSSKEFLDEEPELDYPDVNGAIDEEGWVHRLTEHGKNLAKSTFKSFESASAQLSDQQKANLFSALAEKVPVCSLYIISADNLVVYVGKTTNDIRSRFKGGHSALVKLLKDNYRKKDNLEVRVFDIRIKDKPISNFPVDQKTKVLTCVEQMLARCYEAPFNEKHLGRERMSLEGHDATAKLLTSMSFYPQLQFDAPANTWDLVLDEIP